VRVLYLTTSGALGGAERVVVDLASGMRERGHDVRVVSGDDGPLLERLRPFCEVDLLPFPERFAALGESGRGSAAVLAGLPLVAPQVAGYLRRLRRLAAPWVPDVVHSHGTKAHVLAAWARLPGALVWHLHEYVAARPVSARLLRASAGRLTGAVAVSASVASDFATAVPGRRAWIVRNAVDLARFQAAGPALDLDRAGSLPPAPAGTLRVGLVATYAWWKGHDVFLRALARIPRDIPVRGYVIGGPLYRTRRGSQVQREALEAGIARLGLAERVGLTGFVEDVPAALRSLDVVVHASTEPEPFGLVIAEGMATGRPVVVSAAGGAAEIVRHDVDALTFPPGDEAALAAALTRLAGDAGLRSRLGAAAAATARAQFDRRRAVTEIESIYESCVQWAA
jgi:glycosyltransferase involved in cell wall biosynthesis